MIHPLNPNFRAVEEPLSHVITINVPAGNSPVSRIEVIRLDRRPNPVNGVWTQWQLSRHRQDETEIGMVRRPVPYRMLTNLFKLPCQ